MRAPGFYWLRSKRNRAGPNPFVAYWDGDDWQFIGSLYIVSDDELDDDGEMVMDRYIVVGRVAEPSF